VSHTQLSPSNNRWRYALLLALLAGSMIFGAFLAYEMYGRTNGAVPIVRFLICATSIFAVTLCAVSLLVWGRGRKD